MVRLRNRQTEMKATMRRVVTVSTPRTIVATKIDREKFAPFGDVICPPLSGDRTDWSRPFANTRTNARISLYTAAVEPVALPAALSVLERHPRSFQTFIALNASRYLVCVAPGGDGDLPAIDGLRAFIVSAGTGITYRANVWHHPMMALDRAAQFAVWMWRSGGDDDEEFVELSRPVYVQS